jgi:hypothetical protein
MIARYQITILPATLNLDDSPTDETPPTGKISLPIKLYLEKMTILK